MKVQDYKLHASNGRYIRTATKVILDNGTEIKFIDKMSKRAAIQNTKALTHTYKPIGTGECWDCGEPFHKHI